MLFDRQEWFTLKEAAAYCRYSPSRFRVLVREYQIPRGGPEGSRFKRANLDIFMESPEAFKQTVYTGRGRRGFTPVTA